MRPKIGKIFTEDHLKKGYFSSVAAIMTVAMLSLHVQYLPPFMILWCLTWLMENYSQVDEIRHSRRVLILLFSLFVLYYIWQAVGIIYTTDVKMGLSNLFGRLSLLLFPLVLFYPGAIIKIKIKVLIRIFAASTVLFMVFCFIYALFRSVNISAGHWIFNPHLPEYPWLNYFYGSDLTINQHPSYIAMYVLLSVFICFESWFDFALKFKYRITWLVLGLFLLITQYFLSSRAGILISLLLVPFYFIIKFRELGKSKLAWIGIILIGIALLPVILKNQRVDYLYGKIFNQQVGYQRKEDPRFLIWESALKVSKKNLLFGVGIGDVRTELSREYIVMGQDDMAKERLNAHNQFLEVLLENGIIGLILFISVFFCMAYIGISDRNLLYGIFIIMIFMFFQFESILYRLAGVSFFSLFSFLLIFIDDKIESTDN